MRQLKICKAFGDTMRDSARQKTPLNLSAGSQGGYLVPPEMQLRIDERLHEYSVFHKLAWQVEMHSKECLVPRFDLTAAHATGDSPLFGGLGLRWTSEGVTIAEVEPSFSGHNLVARDLEATVFVSNQMVADGGATLGDYLTWGFAAAVEFAVERGCYQGNGAAQPLGIINAPSTFLVARSSAGHVTLADLSSMVGHLITPAFKRAVWVASPSAVVDILQIAGYTINNWATKDIGDTGVLAGVAYGRPMFVSENLPVLGTKGDVVLFDPSLYALGTRHYEVAVSRDAPGAFQKNQTVFRLWWRGDGVPLAKNTITLADNTTVVAVAVALD